ncbi:hypothetical protein ALC62_01189 [Cyphomyrmex costatus]|uniref:DUF5641 domain-containing protein n=1 Tax=Cyphomyrmex costatus TaxID=456900 RepID=A0A151IPD7_9HYME|nr:hypothetical protein ALC62_01189 [Cyphomyrmex costatus]
MLISAINSTSTRSRVQITIQSMHDDFSKTLTCLTVPAITDLVPVDVFPRNSIHIPSNIRLADPEFHIPRPIDLLASVSVPRPANLEKQLAKFWEIEEVTLERPSSREFWSRWNLEYLNELQKRNK